jgi:SAM-dependent methyltransferase
MLQDFKSYFGNHPEFHLRSGIFFQNHQDHSSDFERLYLQLRRREGRVYDEEMLRKLPIVPNGHPLQKEWNIRHASARRLAEYLKNKKYKRLLEIGAGNGWLLHYLHSSLRVEAAGIDMNAFELEQAARVFGNQAETFVYADIMSGVFNEAIADVIVVASAVQYFPDLRLLIDRLLKLLLPSGEIHILDSPLYNQQGADSARKRSDTYFRKEGAPAMSDHYHHHTWGSLQGYFYQVLYDPLTLRNKVRRVYMADSPFPWISISPF